MVQIFVAIIGLFVVMGIVAFAMKKHNGRHRNIPLVVLLPKSAYLYWNKFPKNKKYINISNVAKIIGWTEDEIRNLKIKTEIREENAEPIIARPFNKTELDRPEYRYLLALIHSKHPEIHEYSKKE